MWYRILTLLTCFEELIWKVRNSVYQKNGCSLLFDVWKHSLKDDEYFLGLLTPPPILSRTEFSWTLCLLYRRYLTLTFLQLIFLGGLYTTQISFIKKNIFFIFFRMTDNTKLNKLNINFKKSDREKKKFMENLMKKLKELWNEN